MTKENQKILYEHFLELSKTGTTDILREHCKHYAEDILKSFPEFEEKPKEETISKKKKER